MFRYIQFLQTHPKKIITLSVLVTLLLAIGIKNLSITNDFRIYFSKDNPQLAAFENLEQTYGKQDSLYFYLRPKKNDVFQKDVISLIWQLTEKSWYLPYAERVNSLTNYQHTTVSGDDLVTDYLVSDPSNLSADDLHKIRRIVLNEPSLINYLVPRQANVTGIRVQLNLPEDNKKATDEAVFAARKLVKQFHRQYPNIEIMLAGSSTAGTTLGEAVQQDLGTLVSWSYIIIIFLLLVLLRSIRGMLLTIALVSFSVIATMGIYGWLGKILTPVAGWVPSIVMTIAVADAIHILISYFHGLRSGKTRQDSIIESMKINANPVFITSITTIIGVLCLNFSDSPPYRDLGNMVALGVLFAYLFTMTFLPATLLMLNIGRSHVNKGANVFMDRFAVKIIANHKPVLLILTVLIVGLISFIPDNELTERWHEYFDETFPLRQAVETINKELTGVHYIRYVIDSHRENGIHEPQYLNLVNNFIDWYRQQDQVAYVSGLTDISKRLNRIVHADEKSFYIIPDNQQLAAQLFLLYEIGLPRELNLDNMVNHNRSASLVTVIIRKTDSEKLLELDKKAQHWLKHNANGFGYSEGSGLDMVFAHINHRNIRSLLKGTLVALLLISFVLIFALRSVRLGLISLVPNLAPAGLAYGTWSLLVGVVDMSASVVICMSLGIVVDDTVHFLSKYRYARINLSQNIETSMRYAFQTVGMALTITTIVLVAGFLVLTASHFSPTWVSGLLLSLTLAYALVGDFLYLPPLLLLLDEKINK